MNKNIHIIISSALLIILNSCTTKEQFDPMPETEKGYNIEFLARPTSYSQFNVSTKVSNNEINNLENTIYTAFFLLFDDEGNRVIFKDLTGNVTTGATAVENGNNLTYLLQDQSIVSDKALTNATACFIANVPTAYAKSLTTVNHLKGKGGASQNEGALPLNYAQITSECIGIPLLTDESKNISEVYSLPMTGVVTCNLSAMSGNTSPIQIPLERLFSKIIVKLSVNIPDDNTTDNNIPQFTLSNYVVNNMPTKVALVTPEAGVDSTAWAASTNPDDYLTQNNWMSNFNLDNGDDDSETVTTGQGAKSLFFYVPEHMVPRDRDNHMITVPEEREQVKPTLFEDASPKKPLYVSIKGNLNIPGSSPMIADYNIYLGENEYDDFNLKRNKLYTNNIVIKGAEFDNRVEFTHGDVSVLFKRATYLDSHFEVRPLRVKWTGMDVDDQGNSKPKTPEGTVTVKILDAYDDNAAIPTWVRIERPDESVRNNKSIYCGTIGKRKYFTTNLVQSDGTNEAILGNNTELSYDITTDTAGDYPTWVYVDEFITPNTDNTFSDAVRQAKIRVTYTPPADSDSKVLNVDYVITQRSVYPVVATNQDKKVLGITTGKYIYGIEYFEEYLYDYDRVDIEDLNDGEYASTQDGMEWGLDGVQLSSQNKSVNFSDLSLSNTRLNSILKLLKDRLNIDLMAVIRVLVNSTIDSEGLPYYDFYMPRDNPGTGVETYDYNGINFNKQILSKMKELDGSRTDINLYLTSEDTPQSVIEYCYNKNKRNSDGTISTLYWYAPAIDEIEDITLSAYRQFDVFQNKMYWSCQPAFHINYVNMPNGKYEIKYLRQNAYVYGDGNYMTDNVGRARATKIDGDGNNVKSGIGTAGYYETMTLVGSTTISITLQPTNDITATKTVNKNIDVTKYDLGNIARAGHKNRVRCVYYPDGISL